MTQVATRPRTVNVLVELDVDAVKDQIRDAVVELVDERDRARHSAVLLEQQLAETRRLLDEALDFRDGAMTLEEIRLELEELDHVVSTCACPAISDGHVCEPS